MQIPRHIEYDLDSRKCSNWQVIDDVIVVASSANYIASVSHTPKFSSSLQLNHFPIVLPRSHILHSHYLQVDVNMYQTEEGMVYMG